MELNSLRRYLLSLLILSVVYNRLAKANICNGKAADIVFVIDSSVSVWKSDFTKQLEFVANTVGDFEIGLDDVRVGVLTYSHNVRLDFHLRQHTSKDSLKNAILNIPFLGGATDIAKAIRFARDEMFKVENGGRSYVNHIVILITEGYSVPEREAETEAHIAKHHGIVIFAIGVGASSNGLIRIASGPLDEFTYIVFNFTTLNSIHEKIANTACKLKNPVQIGKPNSKVNNNEVLEQKDQPADQLTPSKQYCGGKPADIYVVLDSSSSIWEPDFNKELNFTTSLVDIFNISNDKTRVGVVEYSDGIHPVIPLDNGYDKSTLKTKISQLKRLIGGTNTGSVISYLTEHAFHRRVARPNVAHIAVILTDGQSLDPRVTASEATKAHARGIYMFAIGIGRTFDDTELSAIASDPDENFVFRVDSFQALTSIVDILAMKTCEAEKNYNDQQIELALKDGPAVDLMFLFDSYSLGQRKAEMIRKSIGKLIQGTNLHRGGIRVGVMAKVCQKERDIKLSDYQQISSLLEKPKSDGIDKLLRKVRRHGFQTKNGGRKNAKKVAVIFLDEDLHHPEKVLHQAKRTAFKMELFVINIGKTLSKDFVKLICSEPHDEHLVNISGYEDLPEALHQITKKLYINS